jgi:plastocyanin
VYNFQDMNNKKVSSKHTWLIASTVVAAILATVVLTQISEQTLQKTFAENYSSKTTTTMPSTSNVTTFKTIVPNQTTNKEFWINTVHFDGLTNINAGVKCDTCPQNTPLHPAEQPPVNSTIPTGGGFKITEPNKAGAWDFRSFAFAPAQIVVNQGDKVTLHFIGVQGAHHVITVDGIGTFELKRGQINTVSFIANNPGIINYVCHVHAPNMVGQIIVLPKSNV